MTSPAGDSTADLPAVSASARDDYAGASYAQRYARLWEPVLQPAGHRLLDALEPSTVIVAGAAIVDIGCGAGLLSLEAARRWPTARVLGIDPSADMREIARARAATAEIDDGRLTLLDGGAQQLPLTAMSVDMAVSSFVFQIVPDRVAALREARRVLRPGGVLGYVTWLKTDAIAEPRRILEEEVGSLERWTASSAGAGDVPSPEAAVGELRSAGFSRPHAWVEQLQKVWTVDGYLEYFAACWRGPLSSFSAVEREEVLNRLRARLMERFAGELMMSWPIVFAVGSAERRRHTVRSCRPSRP